LLQTFVSVLHNSSSHTQSSGVEKAITSPTDDEEDDGDEDEEEENSLHLDLFGGHFYAESSKPCVLEGHVMSASELRDFGKSILICRNCVCVFFCSGTPKVIVQTYTTEILFAEQEKLKLSISRKFGILNYHILYLSNTNNLKFRSFQGRCPHLRKD